MHRVFIHGASGTTGLKLKERLEQRRDIELLLLGEDDRRDRGKIREMLHTSDIAFLCLPDDAAREAVALAEGSAVRIIDASTAHRTLPGWAYGFPELSEAHRKAIAGGSRVAVPGCHASGLIALIYPLIQAGLLTAGYPVVCHSVTGYSGGGKKMIAQYEAPDAVGLQSPRQYALGQNHKHLPEMQAVTGLAFPPVFNPIVSNFFSGMCVTVPLHTRLMSAGAVPERIYQVMQSAYGGSRFLNVLPLGGGEALADGFLPADTLCGTNQMNILFAGNDDRVLLAAQFDNLGKGASGAAVQCMNIMLGLDEAAGLA